MKPLVERVNLVACVGQKLDRAAPARELYTSDWFRKARAYVERQEREEGIPWFILSAKYGLLHPDAVIPPYEVTLNAMPAAARRQWAARTFRQMRSAGIQRGKVGEVVFLAGRKYREHLVAALQALEGIESVVPMQGLGIGQQKAWLKAALR